MEELKKQVYACQVRRDVGSIVQVNFYTSSVGQHYAILVTKLVWYAVRLFVENEYPDCPRDFTVPVIDNIDEIRSEHLTWNGVQTRIDRINKFFQKPDIDGTGIVWRNSRKRRQHFFCRLPNDYASNPDRYLKRGDIIATTFKIVYHTAIYLGNGQVSHVSGHGGGKAAGVARIGRLLGDFVTTGTETIWIVHMLFRVRFREEVAKKAEEFAANKFRKGEYNIFSRNCQHFVFLCATGVEVGINLRL